MSRTSVFAGRRGTKQGFRIVRQSQTSTKIDANLLRPCFATELRVKNLTLSLKGATSRRFWSPRRVPGRLWAPIFGVLERRRSLFGRSGGVPGTPGDAPATLHGHLRDALGRHWVSHEDLGTDLTSISAVREAPFLLFDLARLVPSRSTLPTTTPTNSPSTELASSDLGRCACIVWVVPRN